MVESREETPRLNMLERLDFALARAIEHGWVESGEDVARKAKPKLSEKYWSATRSKLRSNPNKRLDYDVVERIAKVLKVRPYWLWKGVGKHVLSPYDGLSRAQRDVMKRLSVEAVQNIPSHLRRKALEHTISHLRFLHEQGGDEIHAYWEAEALDILRQYMPVEIAEPARLSG